MTYGENIYSSKTIRLRFSILNTGYVGTLLLIINIIIILLLGVLGLLVLVLLSLSCYSYCNRYCIDIIIFLVLFKLTIFSFMTEFIDKQPQFGSCLLYQRSTCSTF